MSSAHRTIGPPEARITWHTDDEPYDWGDIDPSDDEREAVEDEGVYGCVLETRGPACACCGVRMSWHHAASVWGVTSPGDPSYYHTIEAELMIEAAS